MNDNKINFQPLRFRRLSEAVENSIKDLILNGEVKPGERLPTEKEMSSQFGVSTVTVREALRALESFGCITRRRGHGGGVFVSAITSDSVKTSIYSFLNSKKLTVSHLSEARLIIEPSAIKLVARTINQDEIQELENNIQFCEKKLAKIGRSITEKLFFDIEERNVEFHRIIGEATHNPVLAHMIDYVLDFTFAAKKQLLTPDIEFSVRILKDHRAILQRLIEHDEEGCVREMYAHLENVEYYLEQKESQSQKREPALSGPR